MSEAWWWPWPAALSIVVVLAILILAALTRTRTGFARRTVMTLALGSSIVYLIWRVLFTLPDGGGWGLAVAIVLLVAEVLGVVQFASAVAVAWNPVLPPTPPLTALGELPAVDVFIATYDEQLSVLEPTLAGAVTMRYPGQVVVYLCDDGSRPEVRELAARYGAVHLQRDDHSHAKAGNLNNALAHSSGDLIVTFDADMIPTADFLEKTVGYFVDEKLAFAQAPQAFHNEDPFQYNLFSGSALPNEQDLFMRALQGGKSRFNAVMYVGSNTVFRRTALDDIGGFATGVITEDMATGMLLQAAGWRSVFVPHLIAAGLSPESFSALLVQRARWSRGNIQTIKKWNPLALRGLTAMQRWLYSDGILYWHFGVLKLIFIAAPLFWLISGVPIVQTDLASLAMVWVPYFAASLLAMHTISAGRRSFTWTHIYETAMAPAIALAVFAEWIGLSNKAFQVTPKGVATRSFAFGLRIALPHLVLLGFTAWGVLNVFVFSRDEFTFDSLVISLFWVAYNTVGLIFAVFLCLERPRPRRQERTLVDCDVSAALWPDRTVVGRARDLSVSGVRLFLPWTDGFTLDDAAAERAPNPEVTIGSVGPIAGSVRWVTTSSDGLQLGFEFAELAPAHMSGVVALITQSPDWIGSDLERDASLHRSFWRAASGVARPRTAFARQHVRVPQRGPGRVHLSRAAVRRAGQRTEESAVPVIVEDISVGGCRIRGRLPIAIGDRIHIELPSADGRAVAATVRWVRGRGHRVDAGLQFVPDDPAGDATQESPFEDAEQTFGSVRKNHEP